MADRERECALYVDGEDRDRLVRQLHRRLGGVRDGSTLSVAGVQVRVGRNTARLDTGPLAEFVSWPTLVEVYPVSDRQSTTPVSPAGDPATGPRTAGAAGTVDVAAVGTEPVDVAAVVVEVMAVARRAGSRVVAACDFEDQLPRWDQLRPERVNSEDLDDDGEQTGDDRHRYRGQPFTGTIVDRRVDGGWHETEVRHGTLDGLARTYRPDGSLAREDWYDAGTRVRKRRWYANSRPEIDVRRTDDGHALAGWQWTEDGRPVRPGLWDRLRGQQMVVDTEPGWR